MEFVIPDLIRNPECCWIPAFTGMTRFVVTNKAVYNTIRYRLSGWSFIIISSRRHYVCPRALTMFCLAARLAGIMAAIRESAIKQHINTNSVPGTKLTNNGTGVETPGGV
jgi:hypothetical protein